MLRRHSAFAVVALLAIPLAAFARGGWATITMETLPEYLVAGDSVDLTFTVRSHGITLNGNLKPSVTMTRGEDAVEASAGPAGAPGRYRARVAVPTTGDWTVQLTIAEFNRMSTRLLPIPAVTRGVKPPAQSAEERGKHLFVAKACAFCHVHASLDEQSGIHYAPVLSGRGFKPEYVAAVLKDPTRAVVRSTSFNMPNLGLSDAEIAALVAFVRSGG